MNTAFERVSSSETETLFGNNKIEGKDEWLTPPHIIKSLGEFDLDPCAPVKRPWEMAKNHYTIFDDGLKQNWFGRIWLNPPYGNKTERWLKKLSEHGNGIALVFSRTDNEWFHQTILKYADGIFFTEGRIQFYNVHGKLPKKSGSGAGSVFAAFGEENAEILKEWKAIKGKYISLCQVK